MKLCEDHDCPQLMNCCCEESCSVKSLQLRRELEVINSSPDERDRFSVCEEEEERECRSFEWMPSKIRFMGKMMNTHQTDREIQIDDTVFHEIEDQKLSSSPQLNFAIRVCAECNTTKTPLWRSGPRGPKSLCNACGIRQMKARRATAMATVAENTPHISAETKMKKRRRRCNNCHTQMKKRCTTSEEEKQYLQHIIGSSNRENNPCLQKTFPEEEEEAAILLMAMSYGLVHG